MALPVRIAVLAIVVALSTAGVGIAQRPSGSAKRVDLEPRAPQIPQLPAERLGDEILQDDLPAHDPVVEEAPPIYTREPAHAESAHEEPEFAGPYPPHPGQVHPRLQHQPLRTYLENRPRQLPLQSDSWLNRPFGISYLLGATFLDDPISGVVGGDPGFSYGGRISWDTSASWGVETRIIGGQIGVQDLVGGTDLPPAKLFQWDVNWLYYWTGDTRWRPYFLIGTGLLDIDYFSAVGRHHTTVFEMPFGIGLKYRHSTRLAFRVELLDNYALNSGVQSDMHNVSLTAGMEFRFGGGRSRSYWPWNPGRNWW
jgi:hypothetical protein